MHTPPTDASGGNAPATALFNLMRLFSRLSAHSLQRTFVDHADFPADPHALPLIIDLALNGPQRPSALTDKLHVSAPTVSRVVRSLESSGFVTRNPDPTDARATLVSLTAHGQHTTETVLSMGEHLMQTALSGWSASDTAALTALTGRLFHDFPQHPHTAL